MSTYQYWSLPTADSIRVLRLSPGNSSDEITCALITQSLSAKPEYEAISYVWGDSLEGEYVSCDGGSIWTGRSLLTALRTFRYRDRPRFLWADALCINQADDDPEKGKQIRLMGQIYSQASRVLIHLGEGDDEQVSQAFHLLQLFGSPAFAEFTVLERITQANRIPHYAWNALGDLLRRPWFQRVWVIQEAVKGNHISFYVGTRSQDWETIRAGVEAVVNFSMSGMLQAGGLTPGPDTILLMQSFKDNTRLSRDDLLLERLSLTRQFKAKDPRDKFFGIFAIIGPESAADIKADYSINAKEVYQAVAVYCLTRHRNLRVLSYVSLPDHTPRVDTPSWVPNWDFEGDGPPFTRSHQQYSASSQSVANIHLDGSVLELEGRFVDSIRQLGTVSTPRPPDGAASLSTEDFGESIRMQKYLRLLECKAMALASPTAADSMHTRYDELLRTMICNMSNEGGVAGPDLIACMGIIVRIVELTVHGNPEEKEQFVASLSQQQILGLQLAEILHDVLVGKKTFCITSHGRYAWVPRSSQVGDNIVIFHGADAPFVVRHLGLYPHHTQSNKAHYQLQGESYVHGLMAGEGMRMMPGSESRMVSLR